MKTLEEKKLLVKMARAFGQPVEQELLESIEKEEQFSKILFGEETQPLIEESINEQVELLKEADPPPMPNAGSHLQLNLNEYNHSLQLRRRLDGTMETFVISVLATTNNDDTVATLTWQEFF